MKGHFVYMFLNEREDPLYIGISTNLTTRIETQHFKSLYGNLSFECIEETHSILYHTATSGDDMKIKERYLINTLNPKYNNKMNNENKFSFTIDIDWKLYSINTEELIEVRSLKTQSSGKKITNHKKIIIKVNYSWLDYGFYIDEDKYTYYEILEKEEGDLGEIIINQVLFILVNGEFYISNWKVLGYYFGNYREISKKNNLDPKKDFISVVSNNEIKRCEREESSGKLNSEYGIALAGLCFMKYEIVKKMKLYPQSKIEIFDKKLNKLQHLE